jgi:hypothetical protein
VVSCEYNRLSKYEKVFNLSVLVMLMTLRMLNYPSLFSYLHDLIKQILLYLHFLSSVMLYLYLIVIVTYMADLKIMFQMLRIHVKMRIFTNLINYRYIKVALCFEYNTFVRNCCVFIYSLQSFDTIDSGDFGRNIPNSRKSYRPFDDHSDDSETSSVCSERSFDSYRRTSDVSTV